MDMNPTPFSRLPAFVRLILGAALVGLPELQAQPAAAAITGRVQNVVTGQFLNNARVTVRGTGLEVFTDQTGAYRLPQVPAGKVVLDVFYTGLDPNRPARPRRGPDRARKDFDLTSAARYGEGGVVKLDAFTVATERETDAAAIAVNEQRYAPNLKNVLSTDSLGDMKDGNIGEFLKYVPGIIRRNMITRTAPPWRRMSIRGFALATWSRVSNRRRADGQHVQRHGRLARLLFQSGLDQQHLPHRSHQGPHARQPRRRLSGTVNMVSKSAFERKRHAQLRYNLNLAANSENFSLRAVAAHDRREDLQAEAPAEILTTRCRSPRASASS
jgi:iron complex outermembrane receptor protein